MFSSKSLVMSLVVVLVLAVTLADTAVTDKNLCGPALQAKVHDLCAGRGKRSLDDGECCHK